MDNSNEFIRRTFYSIELKHQSFIDHIENGLSLREFVVLILIIGLETIQS